ATAHRDAAICGPLTVGEGVPHVTDQFRAAPADLVPNRLREGFGHDHAAVHWEQLAPVASKAVGVTLQRGHDVFGRDGTARSRDHSGVDAGGWRVFVEGDAQPFHGTFEPD